MRRCRCRSDRWLLLCCCCCCARIFGLGRWLDRFHRHLLVDRRSLSSHQPTHRLALHPPAHLTLRIHYGFRCNIDVSADQCQIVALRSFSSNGFTGGIGGNVELHLQGGRTIIHPRAR
uniref:Putative secreted protein n=1 Tax=Anopheles marajoara TaxID=58244 RepID=A0A2M4C817_9DIPT